MVERGESYYNKFAFENIQSERKRDFTKYTDDIGKIIHLLGKKRAEILKYLWKNVYNTVSYTELVDEDAGYVMDQCEYKWLSERLLSIKGVMRDYYSQCRLEDRLVLFSINNHTSVILEEVKKKGSIFVPEDRWQIIKSFSGEVQPLSTVCHAVRVENDNEVYPLLSLAQLNFVNQLCLDYPEISNYNDLARSIWLGEEHSKLNEAALWTLKSRTNKRINSVTRGKYSIESKPELGYRIVVNE